MTLAQAPTVTRIRTRIPRPIHQARLPPAPEKELASVVFLAADAHLVSPLAVQMAVSGDVALDVDANAALGNASEVILPVFPLFRLCICTPCGMFRGCLNNYCDECSQIHHLREMWGAAESMYTHEH